MFRQRNIYKAEFFKLLATAVQTKFPIECRKKSTKKLNSQNTSAHNDRGRQNETGFCLQTVAEHFLAVEHNNMVPGT